MGVMKGPVDADGDGTHPFDPRLALNQKRANHAVEGGWGIIGLPGAGETVFRLI